MKTRFLLFAGLLSLLVLATPNASRAQVTITKPALAITTCDYPSAYSPLGNIIITEGAKGDIPEISTQTIIFTAPATFEFEPFVGTATFTASRDITVLDIDVTATTITLTITTDNNMNALDELIISGLSIRAIGPASTGTITRTGGTCTINGLPTTTAISGAITSMSLPSACASATTIPGSGPANSVTAVTPTSGCWDPPTTSCGYATPGGEKIYSFVPAITGEHNIVITAADGTWLDYFWQATSCGPTGWTCIDDKNGTGTFGTMNWTAGTTYYILLDDEDNTASTHTFYIKAPTPMSFVSSTVTQANTSTVNPGSNDNEIIGIQVVTNGSSSPLSVTSFTLNANGTTSIADINTANSATLYYTGTSATFATTNPFGSATPTLTDYTINGTQTLAEGTNYFWLTYDVAGTATEGNYVDAECKSVSVGTAQTPTITAPNGRRLIQTTLNYCTSVPSWTSDEDIYNVTLNGSSTNATYANANNCTNAAPGTGSILNRYSNFTELAPLTTITPNTSVAYSIRIDECDGATYYNNGCGIWIDYNQDGDFDDAGEQIYVDAATAASPRTVAGTFTVPLGATPGNTRMRVIAAEGFSGTGLTPCLTYSYGETEDYTITIAAVANCSGTPAPGNTISSANPVCAGTFFTLSMQNATPGASVTYQWQSSPNNIAWSNISGATATTLTLSQVTQTYYRCVVTCVASSSSANSTSLLVTMIDGSIVYASLPYAQSFESWMDGACSGTTDTPDASWINSAISGNTSWRRDDQGGSAAWTTTGGAYSPVFSIGAHSARFHSYDAASGSSGSLDLYLNCSSGAAGKQISFDYINTSGGDSLSVWYSTDGGSTFTKTGTTLLLSSAWGSKTFGITSSSATTVIRFNATADYGMTDIGMDNLNVCVAAVPGVASTPSPANGATGVNPCTVVQSWVKPAAGACNSPSSYDIYLGTTNPPPFFRNVLTTSIDSPMALMDNTLYYWKVVPKNTAGDAAGCPVWTFTTSTTSNAYYCFTGQSFNSPGYGENCVTITPETNTQLGCAWNRGTISFANAFDYTLNVYFGDNFTGADGCAFVFQNSTQGVSTCGANGAQIGAGGIDHAVVIEFDTYDNDGATNHDLTVDHTAIEIDGDLPDDPNNSPSNQAPFAGPVQADPLDGDLDDGLVHALRVTWDPLTKTIRVYVDGSLRLSATHDFVTNVFGGNPNVNWGFTGSTGGYNNLQYFCPLTIPMPVELTRFDAICETGRVQIDWQTNSESNSNYFLVERSKNLKQWEQVVQQNGAGNSNFPISYQAIDESPQNGTVYYRLKQVDFDGTTEIFDPIEVNCGDVELGTVSYYPNPATSDLTVVFDRLPEMEGRIRIFDATGRLVLTEDISADDIAGTSKTIDLRSLGQGVYSIVFESTMLRRTDKFVKN